MTSQRIDIPTLSWPRAYDWPLLPGEVRQIPADFEVNEILGFEPDEDGEHDLLWLSKEGNNTQWVAEQLAQFAGVATHDVGFCGRKDRRAVTRQWLSVRRPSGAGTDWRRCVISGVDIIRQSRHRRKLRPGGHKANHFVITIRNVRDVDQQIDAACRQISQCGVPNYFGRQRFGRNAANLQLAADAFAGKRQRKSRLGLAISAARAMLFNRILASRIEAGCWQTALPGEAFNLNGNNSLFVTDDINADLQTRLATQDVHPTAALWGRGAVECRGAARQFEEAAVSDLKDWCEGLENIGANAGRRATRLQVGKFSWQLQDGSLRLEFTLRSGGFATAVLSELIADNRPLN